MDRDSLRALLTSRKDPENSMLEGEHHVTEEVKEESIETLVAGRTSVRQQLYSEDADGVSLEVEERHAIEGHTALHKLKIFHINPGSTTCFKALSRLNTIIQSRVLSDEGDGKLKKASKKRKLLKRLKALLKVKDGKGGKGDTTLLEDVENVFNDDGVLEHDGSKTLKADDQEIFVQCTTGHSQMADSTEDGEPIVEGDMVQSDSRGGGSLSAGRPWPGKTVPWCFKPGTTAKTQKVFRQAIALAKQQVPCLKFPEHSYGLGYNSRCKLVVQSSSLGCFANVGVVTNGQNKLNLATGCEFIGTAQHELMHALGETHEQNRADRDRYVKINWQFIPEGKRRNFQRQDAAYTGTVYDYLSIMHYSQTAFSTDKSVPTITGANGQSLQNYIGQRQGYSELDVRHLGVLYQCPVRPLRFNAQQAQELAAQILGGASRGASSGAHHAAPLVSRSVHVSVKKSKRLKITRKGLRRKDMLVPASHTGKGSA